MWKKFFNQVLNVHDSNFVKTMNTNTAEALVTEPSLFEVKLLLES
jgi:hypothetical protein